MPASSQRLFGPAFAGPRRSGGSASGLRRPRSVMLSEAMARCCLEDSARADSMPTSVLEQRVQDQASRRDAPGQLGLNDRPRVPSGRETADDLVRWDQSQLVRDRTVDLDLEPIGEEGTGRPPKAAEVDDLGVLRVIDVVRRHRVRASWRAVRR